ncbi:MAG TPA: hypothetical protein VJM08_09250 [Anaerolineales bacterium]|nr:hypothetical protein [Anaerolineales bacterium]
MQDVIKDALITGYWKSELESLGIKMKSRNSLNDEAELAALTENIKQTYFQDYKSAYDDKQKVGRSHFEHMI